MTYSLGVDLGTTTSAAALRRGSRLEVCALGDLTATMPSVALERADGSLLVGEAASDRALYDTTLVARHVTAHLDDDGPIVLDGRPHDPARLTQALLETVIDRVRRLHGERPHDVVLTYPLFPPGGSAALLQRVGEATAGRALLIPHPIAAVAKLAHDVEIAEGTTVAVLDLGGGTFEATIVRRSRGGFDVVGPPGGLADLGGVEFDDAVFARVDAELGHVLQTVPRDDVEGMAALRRLRVACRAAKEWLSSSPDTTVEVALPGLSTWVPIRRADLESDIRPSLMAAVDTVAQTIAASELDPADVHVALLVGGSSHIPLFGELVASRLGLPIVADRFPELTVALGGALFGADGPAAPPPPPVVAVARDDPAAGARDDVGGDASGDVGALAAWFADPAGGPTRAQSPAAGPGSAVTWDELPGEPADHGWADVDAGDDAGWAAPDDNAWDPERAATEDDAWEPEWDATVVDDPAAALADWEGGEWTESAGHWGVAPDEDAAAASGRRAGPTTGETDLWGPPARRRVRRSNDDEDDDSAARSAEDRAEGPNPRLIAAIICGALAVVAIAGVALATGMGGGDDPQLTLADPARSAITTTTSMSTTAAPPTTTTMSAIATTTEPAPAEEWAPPQTSSTEPSTTAAPTTTTAPPSTTAAPTTTAAPPPTTTAPPTTTTCPGGPAPPGQPGPPTTTTTAPGCH
jgi:Hsp70 protein